jgi:hypothetical protein
LRSSTSRGARSCRLTSSPGPRLASSPPPRSGGSSSPKPSAPSHVPTSGLRLPALPTCDSTSPTTALAATAAPERPCRSRSRGFDPAHGGDVPQTTWQPRADETQARVLQVHAQIPGPPLQRDQTTSRRIHHSGNTLRTTHTARSNLDGEIFIS